MAPVTPEPTTRRWAGAGPEVRETHSGVVVLIGDKAFKMKKPVDMGFLDFTTREARQAACLREVELNRRLAPDIYLGVSDVLAPDGTPCDHLVVMRRMPADRRLSTLVRGRMDVGPQLRDLARLVAAFHAGCLTGDAISAEGGRAAVRRRWSDNVAQTRALAPHVVETGAVDAIERLALEYLEGRAPLFDQRVSAGLVRDGHGDLLADDIFCLDDGPRVLDCLEFDDRLRWMDVLDDVACLVMDLEHLAGPEPAARFLGWYREFSGWPQVRSLEHHYVAYRAFMRAKVSVHRAAQGDRAAHGEARSLSGLARRHLEAGRVRLVLVGGPPGSGKSTVAGGLADHLGAVLLRSDRVRKETAGIDPGTHAPSSWRHGIYDAAHTGATYTELLARAVRALGMGESVVLDASFGEEWQRAAARDAAADSVAALTALRCDLDTTVAAERVRRRNAEGHDVSDADADVAARVAATTAPWPEAHRVDTAPPPQRVLRTLLAELGWHRPPEEG